MDKIETLGERIKLLRKKSGMTQAELGKILSLGHSQVSNLEKNKYQPSNEALSILSNHFKVSFDWLLKGVNFPKTDLNNSFTSKNLSTSTSFSELPFIMVSERSNFVKSLISRKEFSEFTPYRVSNLDEETLKMQPIIIEINGDWMDPQLKSGTKVLAISMSKENWPYITGKVCAIAFKDFLVVKRIKENKLIINGTITINSDNPIGGSLVIKGDEILGIWQTIKALDVEIS